MTEAGANVNLLDQVPDEVSAHFQGMFDSVEINKVSNKGANGILIFGRNRITDRHVAVKYYYWGGDQRLHEEPGRLAAIQHTNIITINHAGYADNDWSYFEMPYLANGDLDDLIENGRKSLREALQLSFGISSGLSQIHSSGMVHRDLKPENILLADDGSAVIADFGSVKMIPEGADGVPGSGHSILYRPPESFDGIYGKSGDVYQTGIVLYQLLGGSLPYAPEEWLVGKQYAEYCELPGDFEKSQYVDVVLENRIKKGRLLDMNSLPAWVPPAIKTLIRQATNRVPGSRIQTPSDLCRLLHQNLLGVPDWIQEGNQISVEHNGKYCCTVPDDEGEWVTKKKVKSGWQRVRSIKAYNADEAVAGLRNYLKI